MDIDFYQNVTVTSEEKLFPDWKDRLTRAEEELQSGPFIPLKQMTKKREKK